MRERNQCSPLDRFALISPLGKGAVSLRGLVKAQEAEQHLGKAPGVPGQHSRCLTFVTRGDSSREMWRCSPCNKLCTEILEVCQVDTAGTCGASHREEARLPENDYSY